MSKTETAWHAIRVPGNVVPAVRTRLEFHLGVETSARPDGDKWMINFEAPPDVDLDFLRPDVLPPKN